jgi:hypothetical protein
MKYPEYAINVLEEEKERIDRAFSRVWAALSPSYERDEIMWHLITAKKKLNDLINSNKEEIKNANTKKS